MTKLLYESYLAILKEELVPALGCTEPIAIAFAAAKAVQWLETMPERIEIWCSGNIIKNVKSVTVPNSGGMKGIEAAAVLGAVGGNPDKGLKVLEDITETHISEARKIIKKKSSTCYLIEGVAEIHIVVKVFKDECSVEVEVAGEHTNITKIKKDGSIVYEKNEMGSPPDFSIDYNCLNVKKIIDFADTVEIESIWPILQNQIDVNMKISNEGLQHDYSANVGKTLLSVHGNNVAIRAKARTAAGSDARMDGCPLPVVINSGSGNQGLTVSLPVIEYAQHLNVSNEKLGRALIISNLVAIHQKQFIGRLSAYCGAISAACGSGAAITYLHGGKYKHIANTITNTIANIGGVICDGAKASCSAKIASAVDAAITAHHMSMNNLVFASGDGIVQENVEETIKSIGKIACDGMRKTDVEIINIMLDKEKFEYELV